ncbi:MAG: exonuclease SbcCD subunit D [Actinomycetales bacterium]|nr:exonuclease SbcCD subunit D [Actinomycetales bacterium]
MRILHTSDWHLGRTLHGVDLLDHQAAYLDHLVELARAERVHAVVVAGDVYDRALPPVRAVELLSETLARLAEVTHVILTPGNHDSATRLGFGAAVMRPEVHVRARVADVGTPVVVPSDDGEAWVYALPYLDPDATRRDLSPDPTDPERDLVRSHEAVMGAAMDRVRAGVAARRAAGGRGHVVVAAHAFVVGGQPSESERDIRVGGVDSVPSGVFAGADYVALGHLHGPQQVSGAGALARYCGSPLAYSFSEVNHRKSTALVTFGEGADDGAPAGEVGAGGDSAAGGARGAVREVAASLARAELIDAPVPRPLADLTGTLDELLSRKHDQHAESWVRVTVTDPVRPGSLVARLEERFAHLLVTRHQPVGVAAGERTLTAVTAASDPVTVVGDFVRHVTGRDPSGAEATVLRAAVEAVEASERSA